MTDMVVAEAIDDVVEAINRLTKAVEELRLEMAKRFPTAEEILLS